MLRIRAGSVHPVTAPPITDGAVLVADDGRIAAVAAHAQVPNPPGARRVEFPDAVLVPGLVNTHTHLELTHLAGRNPEREFSRWIRTIRALKDAVVRLGPVASGRARLGVSPHAPYSVSEPLYRAVAAFARREALPLAVHLAESREETALVRDGAGSFAEALRARGIPVTAHGCSPVQYLLRLGVLERATGWLCIHCVQVDETDIRTLKESGAGLAACPRSNRAHGHGTAPLAGFRAAGIPLGLGTDSVVSAGDVHLWAEAAAAGLDGEDALRMLTIEGARALGLDAEIGSLEVGKQADLAVFPSTALSRPLPPSAALLTVVAGRPVRGYIPAQ